MIKLIEYDLNFDRVFSYFKENLTDTNTLSSILIRSISFKQGKFFTLLPDDLQLETIYEFNRGGIAVGVKEQVHAFVFNELNFHENLIAVFDDVSATFESEFKEPLFLTCGSVYKKEIYYLVTNKINSSDLIDQCFYESDAIWHSLCILSEANLDTSKKELSLQEVANISREVKFIIVGAYDGEGYVFWKTTQ